MKKNYLLYLFTVLFALTIGSSEVKAETPNASGVIYVTQTGAGSKTGDSWTNASDDLQMAINATNVQQVWVAKGTYRPKYRADNMSAANANDRNNAFVLKNNVKVYGGFAGTEAALANRDLTLSTNASILSGDLGTVNTNTDNAYHVVISAGTVGTATLNGFTVKDGNANDYGSIVVNSKDIMQHNGGGIYNAYSSPVLTNVSISANTATNSGGGIFNEYSSPVLTNATINENTATNGSGGGISNSYSTPVLNHVSISANTATNGYGGGISNSSYSTPVLNHVSISANTATNGGGIYNISYSTPVLTNVSVSANIAIYNGGGIFNYLSSLVLTNVSISRNTATYSGGGIFNEYSSPVLTNVSISGNTTTDGYGGGIYNHNSSSNPQIRNSIIYGNNSGIGGIGTPVISYSLVQNLSNTTNGNIDGSTNPQFVDAANGDYSLKNTSSVINKGSDTYFAAGQTPNLNAITTDIAGNTRIQKGNIDMGAYESPYSTPLAPNASGVIYVTQTGAGSKSGDSWTNASDDLQMAINATNVQQVWVAGGTYKPKYRADNMSDANANDRNNAFVLKNNVKVYGGFAGTEAALSDRDLNNTANATTLSGDFNGDDAGFTNNGENAYHVVVSSGNNNSAMLNGFTLSGANASSSTDILINGNQVYQCSGGGIYLSVSSPVLQNLMITRNTVGESGGGIFGYESSPVLSGITIQGNQARHGGGMANQSHSSPVLSNIVITGNGASELGGGLYNVNSSSPVLTNVTISGNTASDGGGVYNEDSSSPQIRNSIIYGNNNSGIGNNGSTPVISYSLVQGLSSAADGNIPDTDPKFVDAPNGNYSLAAISPAINKGSNTYFATGQTPDLNAITTDIAGNTRIIETTIDMGAYEYQSPLPVSLINFTAKADGNRAKLEWQTATETNNALFIVYRSSNGEDFTAIDQKAGLGTSATGGNYLIYDNSPLTGTNYYKLVQVDKDGTATDLEIRVLRFTLSAISFKLYPNPAKDYVNMEFEAGRHSTVQLHNIQGQLLQEVKLQASQSELKVSVEDLSSGVYYVTLTGKGEREVKKLVVAK